MDFHGPIVAVALGEVLLGYSPKDFNEQTLRNCLKGHIHQNKIFLDVSMKVNNMLVYYVLHFVKLTWNTLNTTGKGRIQLAPTLRCKDTSCPVGERDKLEFLHGSMAERFCKASTLETVKNTCELLPHSTRTVPTQGERNT